MGWPRIMHGHLFEPNPEYMCLIAVAWNCRPETPLIVASNRDEFHARDTAALAFWEDSPQLCAGRDLVAGGSWMGITRSGRFAAVTNIREAPSERITALRSRGDLVRNFLLSDVDPGDWMRQLVAHAGDYGGFNLLAGCIGQGLHYLSNRGDIYRELGDGVHSLSNGQLDAGWPKQEGLRNGMHDYLQAATDAPDRLFGLLADRRCPDDADLPDTGVGLTLERLLGPRFIVSPAYGTRCSTVLQCGQSEVDIEERRFDPAGFSSGSTKLHFHYRASF